MTFDRRCKKHASNFHELSKSPHCAIKSCRQVEMKSGLQTESKRTTQVATDICRLHSPGHVYVRSGDRTWLWNLAMAQARGAPVPSGLKLLKGRGKHVETSVNHIICTGFSLGKATGKLCHGILSLELSSGNCNISQIIIMGKHAQLNSM